MAYDWSSAFQGGLKSYESIQPEEEYKRGILDRVLGTIQNTSITNALYNATDQNSDTGFIEGLAQGIGAMNPIADDVREGTHTMSDVLGNLGWNPESLPGKIGKGAVSLAGDIALDPITYINPFSAVGKVVSGTGKTVRGMEKSMLTTEQAQKIISTIYKDRGIDATKVNPAMYKAEVDDLVNQFNSKIMKIKEGGEDLQVGMKNLPFTDKVKVGDKTLDTFNKVLVDSNKLRSVGDSTIAPYYQQMIQKIRTSKTYSKLNKNADLMKKAETDPEGAAMIFKLERMHKGFSPSHMADDLGSMNAANQASKMWEEFTPEEKSEFVKRYENGDFNNWFEGQRIIAEKIDKVKGTSDATKKLDDMEKAIVIEIQKMQEAMKVDKTKYVNDLHKGKYDGAINEFVNNFDESKGLMTPADNELDKQINERTVDDKMENVLKRYGYIPTADSLPKPKGAYDPESETILNGVPLAKYNLEHGFKVDATPFIDEHFDKFKRGGELRNELIKMMKAELPAEIRGELDGIRLFSDDSKAEFTKEVNSKLFGGEEVLTPDMNDKVFNRIQKAIQEKNPNEFRRAISDVYAVKDLDVNSGGLWDNAIERAQEHLTPEFFSHYDGTPVTQIKGIRNKVYYGDKKNPTFVELKDIPKLADNYVAYKRNGGLAGIDENIARVTKELEHMQMVAEKYPRNYFSQRMRSFTFQINRLKALKESANQYKMLDTVRKSLGLKSMDELANVDPKLLDDYSTMIDKTRLSLYNDIHGSKFGNVNQIWDGTSKRTVRDMHYDKNRDYFLDDLQGELRVPDIREQHLKKEGIETTASERGFQVQKSWDKENKSYNYDYFERPDDGFESPSAGYAGQLSDDEMKVNATDTVKGKWFHARVNAFEPKTKADLLKFYQRQYTDQIGIEPKILRGMAKRDIVHDNTIKAWKKLSDEDRLAVKRHYAFFQETARRKELDAMPINKVRQLAENESDETMKKYYDMYLDRINPEGVSLGKRLENRMGQQAASDAQRLMKNNEIDEDLFPELTEAMTKESPESVETMKEVADVLHMESPTDKFHTLAKYLSEHMSAIGDREVLHGRLKREQVDMMRGKYLTHLQTDEAKKWVMENITKDYSDSGGFNPKTFAVGYEKKFNDGRKFKTIEEANRVMKERTGVDKWFEDDVVKILQARSLASNRLVFNDEMTSAVRMIAGKPYEAGKELEGHTPVATYVDLSNKLRRLFDGQVPDDVLTYLDLDQRMFSPNNAYIPLTDDQIDKIRQLTGSQAETGVPPVDFFNLEDEMLGRLNRESAIQKRMNQNHLLNLYDKWLTIWKLNNTTITPGFHLQNMVSNAFQSFMSDGKAVIEPSRIKQAQEIFTGKNPNQKIKIGDYNLTADQYKILAEKYGILSNTFFEKDIRFGMEDGGFLKKFGVEGKYDPTDVNEFVPYRKGAEIGANIEGVQRMVLFLKGLEDGKSIEESVENVNKFLFDYSDLTDFEKDTMKRVFPFYTFMRKNVPLQLEQLFTQPFLYATTDRVFDNVEKMSGDNYVEDAQRNQWKRDYTQLPFQIDGQNYGVNVQLPQQQLDRLTLRRLLGQTTPLVKVPLEAATGKYIYTGIPIQSPLEYLLNQTQYTKMGNVSSQKEGSAKDMYIMGQLTGLPMGNL